MSRAIDKLELSQNNRRGYRNGVSAEQLPIHVTSRNAKHIMRAIQIGLGVLSGTMVCIMLIAG